MAWLTTALAGIGGKIAAGGALVAAGLLWLWNMRRKARGEGRRQAREDFTNEQRRLADDNRNKMAGARRPVDQRGAADSVRDRARGRGR